MNIAILTFDGFNELDSLLALGILRQVKSPDWTVSIACPTDTVTSMNGVVLHSQMNWQAVCEADVVLVGSGVKTREICADEHLLHSLKMDPERQLIGSQCSGALVLARLGLLPERAASTDLTTKPWVEEAGVAVVEQPFFAVGNVATAGGCLASQYLAGWVIARLKGLEAARQALHYVAPVGEKIAYVERAISHISPYLQDVVRSACQAAEPSIH
ncbi:DJ-1/PfpI family protein [Oceanobacter mangrovi]|uniref:DJ-1/PfpI family protein n=1 Tax=Oceanobacter mangrovi TaxID=2862510 RepID=UPI001C8E3FF1|nr:DJ-1/PfpI family protein [Oceanobacter mangrovi]